MNWGLEGLGCKLLSGGVTVFGLKFTVFLVTGVFLSIPGVACSNFAPVEGPKIVTVFGLKTVLFITVFTGITVFSIPVNRTGFLSIPEYYCLRM